MVIPRILHRYFFPIAFLVSLMIGAGVVRATTFSPVCGTWRGNSECVQSDSPCHDEVNVYRFAEIPGKPNTFSGSGSKIVDGKEIEMGTLEWTFDPQYHALETQISGNTFHLVVMGNKMEGTLKSANHVTYRRIHLQRAE